MLGREAEMEGEISELGTKHQTVGVPIARESMKMTDLEARGSLKMADLVRWEIP